MRSSGSRHAMLPEGMTEENWTCEECVLRYCRRSDTRWGRGARRLYSPFAYVMAKLWVGTRRASGSFEEWLRAIGTRRKCVGQPSDVSKAEEGTAVARFGFVCMCRYVVSGCELLTVTGRVEEACDV